MKKIYAFAMVAALATAFNAGAQTFEGIGTGNHTNFVYTILDEAAQTVSVSAKNLSGNSLKVTGDVVIPATVVNGGKTYTVVELGSFNYSYNVTSITLPATVKTVVESALSSKSTLTAINLENVTTIGKSAFQKTGLTTVTLSPELAVIPNTAFNASALESIEIPAGVKTIEAQAFTNTQLTDVTIPATVEELGTAAFSNCKYLEKITFAEGSPITELPMNFALGTTALSEIILPEGLEVIGDYALGLTTASQAVGAADPFVVTLPETLKSIGRNAFIRRNLHEITFPASVELIGYGAFQMCYDIEQVTVEGGAPIAEGVYSNMTLLFENQVYQNAVLNVPEGTAELFQSEDAGDWAKFQNIEEFDVATGIEGINAAEVASVKFVDLSGRVSSQAFDGVNIVVTTYNDGTVKTAKVIK